MYLMNTDWIEIQNSKDLFHEILSFLRLSEIVECITTSESWRKQTVGCRIWDCAPGPKYMKNIHKIYGFRYMVLYVNRYPSDRGINIAEEIRTVFTELKFLFLNPNDRIVINPGSLPSTITRLELGREFAVMPIPGSFHSGLIHLEFSNLFNYSFANLLPETLQYLYTGAVFNLPIDPGTLPQSLTYLKFGSEFNQKLFPGSLPNKLQTLIFGHEFITEIDQNVLPESLTKLHFVSYNHKFCSLPKTLKTLSVGSGWNQPIFPGDFPTGLTELYISDETYCSSLLGDFNRPIALRALPDTITRLVIGSRFPLTIDTGILPRSLKVLMILSQSGFTVNLPSEWKARVGSEYGILYSTQTNEYLGSCGFLRRGLNSFLKVIE